MSHSGLFDFTGFTGFDNNDFGCGNFSVLDDLFDMGNKAGLNLQNHQDGDHNTYENGSWYLQSEVDGIGQPYTGVEVLGGLDGFSNLHDPVAAPTTLFPRDQVSFDQEDGTVNPAHLQLATNPPFSIHTHSPVPALSYGSGSPSTSCSASVTDTPDPDVTQVAPFGEEHQSRIEIPDPDPFGLVALSMASSFNVPGATTFGTPFPASVASVSGPRRTKQRGKGQRKYNPAKSKKGKEVDEGGDEDGWEVTLAHFQAELYNIVLNGRVEPSGRSSPGTALAAEITKFAKEELKRSPLQGTRAGEGKRPRNVEDYLSGILGEMIPALLTNPDGSEEISAKVGFLSRLANLMESRLVAVNQSSVLRRPWVASSSQVGKGARHEQTEERVKKNQHEKAKRDGERLHLERMSHLFRVSNPQQTWTRVDVLCFAAVFLLYGPGAFSPGFVHVVPVKQGL